MATLYIAEIVDVALSRHGSPPELAQVPPVAEQTVAIGGSSTQSSAFGSTTRVVRVHVDSICSIAFGTNPTATTSTMRMAAGQTEYFAVPVGQSYKIAVIQNT